MIQFSLTHQDRLFKSGRSISEKPRCSCLLVLVYIERHDKTMTKNELGKEHIYFFVYFQVTQHH